MERKQGENTKVIVACVSSIGDTTKIRITGTHFSWKKRKKWEHQLLGENK